MAESKTKVKRIVRFLSADYFEPSVDASTGTDVRLLRTARRGSEIELTVDEEERLDGLGALLPAGANPEDAEAELEPIRDFYRAQRGDGAAMERMYARAAAGGRPPTQDTTGGIEDVSVKAGVAPDD